MLLAFVYGLVAFMMFAYGLVLHLFNEFFRIIISSFSSFDIFGAGRDLVSLSILRSPLFFLPNKFPPTCTVRDCGIKTSFFCGANLAISVSITVRTRF